MVDIPGAENRPYISLIDDNDTAPVQFDIDERLKINFNPTVDNRAEDWSAFVTEPVPFAGFKQTCVVLKRPKEKGSEVYSDLKIADTVKLTFTDESAVQKACDQYKKITVSLQVVVHEKALKRQINALRELQDHQPQLHQVLLYPRYTEPDQVDIFKSVGPSNIERQIARLTLSHTQRQALDYCRTLPFGIGLIQGPPGIGENHWCAEMVYLFLLLRLQAKEACQVLVTAPTNACKSVGAIKQNHLHAS